MRGLALTALAAGSLVWLARPANAAEITKVMSSFDKDMPFGLDLDVGYERDQRRGLINRENHQDGTIEDVAELRYTEITQSLPIHLAVGLWHDLELHASLPIVLGDDRSWGYPGLDSTGHVVTDANTSTVQNNCITPRGTYNCSDPAAGPIFKTPGAAYRQGVGNLTVGAAFAPFSEKRDSSKPTWLIGFDYTYPLADAIDPTLATTSDKPGPLGDKVHRYTPYMAMSKRVGAIDPYIKIQAVIPVLGPDYYSNCDHPEKLAYAENCGTGPWDRPTTGEKPPYYGTAIFGAEFWAYDDPERHQAVTIDLRGVGTFVSEGRYYNELSDALGKLLYTEQYMTLGGQITVNARAAPYVQLQLTAGYYHDTDHFLTDESVGQDLDGNKEVDLDNHNHEINPTYDFRYDSVGRRFRISQVNVFTVAATGVLTF
jgi:hypothetical protein